MENELEKLINNIEQAEEIVNRLADSAQKYKKIKVRPLPKFDTKENNMYKFDNVAAYRNRD